MQVTRSSLATGAGSSDWFTGAVYIDTIAVPTTASRVSASTVHFTPGARTAWHTHPNGQTIFVLEGVGLAQHRGGPIQVIRPGERRLHRLQLTVGEGRSVQGKLKGLNADRINRIGYQLRNHQRFRADRAACGKNAINGFSGHSRIGLRDTDGCFGAKYLRGAFKFPQVIQVREQ